MCISTAPVGEVEGASTHASRELAVKAEMQPPERSPGSPIRLMSRDRCGWKLMSQIQGPRAELILTRCELAP